MWSKLLWKAEPIKKKRLLQYKNVLISQELGEEFDTIQDEYSDWKTKIEGLSEASIGITGRGHKKDGSAGRKTLLEHVDEHVNGKVQRKGMPPRRGINSYIRKLDGWILEKNILFTERIRKQILRDINSIIKMGGEKSDTNPQNIKFTQPEEVGKNEQGKYVDIGTEEVYGHYRTPMYIDSRNKVHNKKGKLEKIPAVSDSWWSTSKGEAKPPFWQAIFAGSSLGEAGEDVTKGLLGILESFKKALDEAHIPTLIIKDKGDMKGKIASLSKLSPLVKEVKKIMKDPRTYKTGTSAHILMYEGNPNRILDRLNDKSFNINKFSSKYLADIAGIEEILGHDDINTFKIRFTKPTVNHMINTWVRGQGDFLAPNGKPFLLGGRGKINSTTGQPYSQGYKEALERSKLKKSWIDSLWS